MSDCYLLCVCVMFWLLVLCFYYSFFCLFSICMQVYWPLPPGGNPIAVNKYHIYHKISYLYRYSRIGTSWPVLGRTLPVLYHYPYDWRKCAHSCHMPASPSIKFTHETGRCKINRHWLSDVCCRTRLGERMVSMSSTLVETVSINYEDFNESFLTCGTCLCESTQ